MTQFGTAVPVMRTCLALGGLTGTGTAAGLASLGLLLRGQSSPGRPRTECPGCERRQGLQASASPPRGSAWDSPPDSLDKNRATALMQRKRTCSDAPHLINLLTINRYILDIGVSGRSPECLRRVRSNLADQVRVDIVRYTPGILPLSVPCLRCSTGVILGERCWQSAPKTG